MVQANVDRIIDFLKTKKSASIPEIAKSLNIPKEDVQKSAGYLEEDGVIRMDYKFTTPYLTFVKEPFSQEKPGSQGMHLDEPKEQAKETRQIQNMPEKDFFLSEPAASQKENPFAPTPEKNLSGTMSFMQFPSEEPKKDDLKITIPDSNPFENKPNFELGAPAPEDSGMENTPRPVLKPVLGYTEDYSESVKHDFPEYISTDLDKLDFLIDDANNNIKNYKYKGMNVVYRKIFNLYNDADLSPNERYLIGNKINDLFQRMRRIYTVEHSV